MSIHSLIDRLLQVATYVVCAVIIFFSIMLLFPFKARVDYASVNGSQVAYYTRGSGKPLLLIEGFGMTIEDWDPALIKNLSKFHKVIVYDLGGAGLSKGGNELSIPGLADDATTLLQKLGIEKADILGWSMGSLIAQEVAISHPENVDHLILASTFPADIHMIDSTSKATDHVASNLSDTWLSLVPLLFNQDADGKDALDSYLLRKEKAIKNGETPNTPGESVQVKIALEEAMGQISGKDRLPELAKIAASTLVIAGQDDILVPIENDKIVARAIPHSILKIFPRSGHAFLFRDSQEVTDTISQFLR